MASLFFRIHEVRCHDETGSGIEEWATDDIRMAAVYINSDSQVNRTETMEVGEFDDKEFKAYDPPRSIVKFDLPAEGYPHPFAVIFVLYEEDSGGSIDQFLDEMVERFREQLTTRSLRSLLAEAAAVAGIISAIAAISKGIYEIWQGDEIFPPTHHVLSLDTPESVDTRVASEWFRAHEGRYEVKWSWLVE